MAKVDYKQLGKLAGRLSKLKEEEIAQFNEEAIKDLAARLWRKLRMRTPVGEYGTEYQQTLKSGKRKGETVTRYRNPSGKKGGTLRERWTIGEAVRTADGYSIEIVNPMEYASYVEFGHRTRNHRGWVPGRFMLTISEQELEADAPRILENKLKALLGGLFK